MKGKKKQKNKTENRIKQLEQDAEEIGKIKKSLDQALLTIEHLSGTVKNYGDNIEKLNNDFVALDQSLNHFDSSIDKMQDHLARVRESQQFISAKLDSIGPMVDSKLRSFQPTAAATKTVGYEKIIQSEKHGQIKKIMLKTLPIEKKGPVKAADPRIVEAKEEMAKAGL